MLFPLYVVAADFRMFRNLIKSGESCSDHIALLKAFEAWKEARRGGRERAFCWENFLSPVTLQMMEDMRKQFLDLLSDIGFVDKAKGAKVWILSFCSNCNMFLCYLLVGNYFIKGILTLDHPFSSN